MAWLQAASFGISALGHVLNRTGGRKNVKATLADTSFIEDEVSTIRERNDQMSDKFLRTANANTGFGEMASNRMGSAMGVGNANSMLESARMGGLEGAYNASLANEQQSQGQINQLMGQRGQMEMFNAQAQNDATASNAMMARSDTRNVFSSLQAGMLGYANQRLDNTRFGMSMDAQNKSFAFNEKMYNDWMRMQNGGQVGSNGVPLPNVPYGSNFK